MRTPKIHGLLLFVLMTLSLTLSAQEKSLHQLQLKFVDLRLGMFVHFGLPTFQEADWTDPDLEPGVFNPTKLDTRQWVETAKSAGCKFICVSVKHHAGFCMWDTATTDYSVMNTPLGRDVLKELTTALREAGMQVMFHYVRRLGRPALHRGNRGLLTSASNTYENGNLPSDEDGRAGRGLLRPHPGDDAEAPDPPGGGVR